MSRPTRPNTAADRRMRRLFGMQLHALRERAGLTQAELAGPAISRAGIAKIESGASFPSLDALEHLALTLRVTPRNLIPTDL